MKLAFQMALTGWLLLTMNSTALAQGTAFVYQGRLNDGNSPANGSYDFQFLLYDNSTNGNQQGSVWTNAATAVSNGLFTTTIDFGAGVFTGASLWLEISVRTNGGGGFAMLTPRQQIRPTPYAVFANTASNAVVAASASSVAATNLVGVLSAAQLPAAVFTNGASGVNISGNFSGNGAGLTNLSSAAIVSGGGITNNATVSIYNRPPLTGVALWADPFMVTATNNQPLAYVADTSGNGNNLYNGTSNNVLYYSAGINGCPGFGFPAVYSGSSLVVSYGLTNQIWTPAMNTNNCITIVFKDNLEYTLNTTYLFAAGTNLSYLANPYDVGHSGGSLYVGQPMLNRQNLQGSYLPYVFSERLNNGLVDVWFNGAPTMPTFLRGPVVGAGVGSALAFGDAVYGSQVISESPYRLGCVSGVMGDIIVQTNPPSDNELSNLQNYLLKKYGIGGGVEIILEGVNQMQGPYSANGSNMMQLVQRSLPGTFVQSVSISGQTAAFQLSSESNWCHYAVPGTASKKIVVEWWGERDLQVGTPLSVFTNDCIASVNLLHASGMVVVGCTLVSDTNELNPVITRSNVNNFIKNSGIYDYVCDFAADPDMGYNGAYVNSNFYFNNSAYVFLNSQGYYRLANRWLIPTLRQIINGNTVAATNGAFTGNWTNAFAFPVAVVMTNSTATAVFSVSGVNVIPAAANPANFTVGIGGWLTNASGGGFYYSSQ
jgi:hypothetical protein